MQDDPHYELIKQRRNELKRECRSCCCLFFKDGRAEEARFLKEVIEYYKKVKANNSIAAVVRFKRDQLDIDTDVFTQATRDALQGKHATQSPSNEKVKLVVNRPGYERIV
jgi:hypothetical protein